MKVIKNWIFIKLLTGEADGEKVEVKVPKGCLLIHSGKQVKKHCKMDHFLVLMVYDFYDLGIRYLFKVDGLPLRGYDGLLFEWELLLVFTTCLVGFAYG